LISGTNANLAALLDNEVRPMNKFTELKVWDPLVRVFHWSLVVAFAMAYFTEEDQLGIHVVAGYTVLGLVLFRILWGFVGTSHARFSDFVVKPASAIQYLKDILGRTAQRYVGHNPAGGAMIVLLLVSLLITTFTGLAAYGAGKHAGPLAAWFVSSSAFWKDAFKETHEFFANFTLALVVVHVGGVIVESLLHRENLVRAMVTGRKRA
jgi:cytochrome b